jgi:hypothetical protein
MIDWDTAYSSGPVRQVYAAAPAVAQVQSAEPEPCREAYRCSCGFTGDESQFIFNRYTRKNGSVARYKQCCRRCHISRVQRAAAKRRVG